MYFATVEDLKIALWRALIYPAAHKRELNDLENGFRASIAVTEAQWKAFYTFYGSRNATHAFSLLKSSAKWRS